MSTDILNNKVTYYEEEGRIIPTSPLGNYRFVSNVMRIWLMETKSVEGLKTTYKYCSGWGSLQYWESSTSLKIKR